MDLFSFLIPTFIAYRKGARGVWLFAIFWFSWIAFVIWLVRGDDKRQARERERQREDAELERTLMIVRAMNPALADEIAGKKAYERLSPLMAAPPPAKARRTHPGMVLLVIVLLVGLFNFVKVLATLEPQPPAPPHDASLTGSVPGVRSVDMPRHGRGE